MKTAIIKLPAVNAEEHPQTDLRRVLVAIDFSVESLAAMRFAAGLTARSGGTLMMVHVVEPVFTVVESSNGGSNGAETEHQKLERAKHKLGALGRGLFNQCRVVETAVRSGIAFFEIIEVAKALRADLIVIGTRGDSALANTPLGCTVEQVVRHASTPVLVVR